MKNETATEPATPQLTESDVARLELRLQHVFSNWHKPGEALDILKNGFPALIRDWRALKARIAELEHDYGDLTKEADTAEETMLRKLYGR